MHGRDVPRALLFFSCVVWGVKGQKGKVKRLKVKRSKGKSGERLPSNGDILLFDPSAWTCSCGFHVHKGNSENSRGPGTRVLARLKKSVSSSGFCWQSYCEAAWKAFAKKLWVAAWALPGNTFPLSWSGSRGGRRAQQSAGSICLWCPEAPVRAATPHGGGLVTKSFRLLRPRGLEPARLLCPWGFQAGTLEWVALPSSRGTSRCRGQTCIF